MLFTGALLPREFYTRDTLTVARELIGCQLLVLKRQFSASEAEGGFCAGDELVSFGAKIVECEAYLGKNDKACHSYKSNPGGRTNIMYNEGGYAYVYLIYGMYNCFNVVTQKEGKPEAVLLRALEPQSGTDKKLCSGPGKLCREANITRKDYGEDLCAEVPSRIIIIKPQDFTPPKITAAPRIGVDYAEEAAAFPYRFYQTDSPSVSKKLKQAKQD